MIVHARGTGDTESPEKQYISPMRLKQFTVTKAISESLGLKPFHTDALPSVIALIGRNGSGKSRYLNLIERQLSNLDDPYTGNKLIHGLPEPLRLNFSDEDKHYIDFIRYTRHKRDDHLFEDHDTFASRKEFLAVQERISRDKINSPHVRRKYEQIESNYNRIRDSLQAEISAHVIRIKDSDIRSLLQSTQVKHTAVGSDDFGAMLSHVSNRLQGGVIQVIQNSALRYLSRLPHQLVYDYNKAFGDEQEYTRTKAFKEYKSLQTMLGRFLHKKLEWKSRNSESTLSDEGVTSRTVGYWTLGGVEFRYDSLSDGEKILLAYALLFFLIDLNEKIRLRDCIILIDEPELHLHPEAELAVVRALQGIVSKSGQLIIATHSLAIISSLELRSLFLVKEGQLIRPGRETPVQALIDLMGIEEHVDRMVDFLCGVDRWAYISFVEQCLLQPEVIDQAGSQDPQYILLQQALKKIAKGTVLLDFGAGRGRLISEIRKSKDMKWSIEALEPNKDLHAHLIKNGASKVYSNPAELTVGKFDVVFMCGVLHEIVVNEWESTLKLIGSSLKNGGWLVIVEDCVLPRGEYIPDHGFLIMDGESLTTMFGEENVIQLQHAEERYKERILCACITKSGIHTLNRDAILSGLLGRKERVRKSIVNLRGQDFLPKDSLAIGRKLAYASQLYVNLDLALEVLNKK